MHWFLTGLLIVVTAGVAAWTGWLLRRLFVTEPAVAVTRSTAGDEVRGEPEEGP